MSKKPYDRNRSEKEDNKQNASSRSVNRDTSGERRCYKCDALGHIAKDCGKEVPGIRCYSCGERGHKAPQCPGKLGVAASSIGNAPSAAAMGKGVATTSGRVFILTQKAAEATPEVVSGTTSFI